MADGRRTIWRWRSGSPPHAADDEVAVEEPLEIRLRGRSLSVTMRTPGHDEELAAGMLLGEGVVGARGDLERIEHCARAEEDNVLNVILSPHVHFDPERLSRHVLTSSSCGLCGRTTIEAVGRSGRPLGCDLLVESAVLESLPGKLGAAQAIFAQTGGLHAAGVFGAAGDLLVAREDVGRHNAVDKALGWALLAGLLPLERHVLMVSGRASFEIVQKALAARIALVAAVSAPSSLAVDLAQASGQCLVGFLRPGRMNVYAHPERVRFAGEGTKARRHEGMEGAGGARL